MKRFQPTHTGKPGRPKAPGMNLARSILPESSERSQKRLARAFSHCQSLESLGDGKATEIFQEALDHAGRQNGTLNVSKLVRFTESRLVRKLVETYGLEAFNE